MLRCPACRCKCRPYGRVQMRCCGCSRVFYQDHGARALRARQRNREACRERYDRITLRTLLGASLRPAPVDAVEAFERRLAWIADNGGPDARQLGHSLWWLRTNLGLPLSA